MFLFFFSLHFWFFFHFFPSHKKKLNLTTTDVYRSQLEQTNVCLTINFNELRHNQSKISVYKDQCPRIYNLQRIQLITDYGPNININLPIGWSTIVFFLFKTYTHAELRENLLSDPKMFFLTFLIRKN